MTEPPRGRDPLDAAGVVLLVALGAAALAASTDFSPLGAVFPRAIGAALVALGLCYLTLIAMRRTPRLSGLEGSNLRRAGVAIVMLAWAFTLEPLGFLVSSAGSVAALLVIANHTRWTPLKAAGYGTSVALVLAVLYLLFAVALRIPLP